MNLTAVIIIGVVLMLSRSSMVDTSQWKYFSLSEFTRSDTATRLGLSNQPNATQLRALDNLVRNVLDPLRQHLTDEFGEDVPVRVTGGFRTKAVNDAIPGSSSTSDHMAGEAADIKVDGMTSRELADTIARIGLPFDQLIYYEDGRGHVHVSLRLTEGQRGERLRVDAYGDYHAVAA